MTAHRSGLCHLVIDCDDLDRASAFWCAALDATAEGVDPQSTQVYRRLRLPDSEIRVLLQRTTDQKCGKERMHFDIEADDGLLARYLERIPVVALDGVELSDFFVNEVELRALLDARVRRA